MFGLGADISILIMVWGQHGRDIQNQPYVKRDSPFKSI